MVSLTGDVATGKEIARTAAASLKRVHLELGGKAPVIVFDDADMDARRPGHQDGGLLQQRPGLHGGLPPLRERARLRQAARRARARCRVAQGRQPQGRATRTWDRVISAEHRKRVGGFLDRAKAAGTSASHGRRRRRRQGVLVPADDRRRREAERRDRQEGSLRPRHHRHALRRATTRRCAGPTTWTTGSSASVWTQRRQPRAERGAAGCGSGRCGSTTTCRSCPRCRTAATSSRATARTCPCTRSRTTPDQARHGPNLPDRRLQLPPVLKTGSGLEKCDLGDIPNSCVGRHQGRGQVSRNVILGSVALEYCPGSSSRFERPDPQARRSRRS